MRWGFVPSCRIGHSSSNVPPTAPPVLKVQIPATWRVPYLSTPVTPEYVAGTRYGADGKLAGAASLTECHTSEGTQVVVSSGLDQLYMCGVHNITG